MVFKKTVAKPVKKVAKAKDPKPEKKVEEVEEVEVEPTPDGVPAEIEELPGGGTRET